MKYKTLYFIILAGLIFILIASFGNGIWNRPLDYTDWQYRVFRGVCHQLPDRSFHINSVPMAVNTRCFGIFSGLLAAWIWVPYLIDITKGEKWPGYFLGITVFVHVIDFLAGQLSVWNSSNFSRFFLGIFLGIALVCMISDQFYKPNIE